MIRGIIIGFLAALVVVLAVLLFLRPSIGTGTLGPTATATVAPTATPTTAPVVVNTTPAPTNPPPAPTQPPAPINTDPTNGPQGQPLPATVTGPAIVEYWGGAVNTANQAINCGVFKLPAGQTFTWSELGRYWTYTSDAAVNANWSGHVASYEAKSVNSQCTGRTEPSSS